ncbi:MAG: hypothetical protein WBW41_13675 [Verrucomicrobiia bacterium]
MPTAFDQAFQKVKQLVADFRANEKFYLSADYQEQEARRDFIDKFWLALGWDVNHEAQKNPFEQEVKVERREHGLPTDSPAAPRPCLPNIRSGHVKLRHVPGHVKLPTSPRLR